MLKGIGKTDEEPPELWQSFEGATFSILHTGVGKANAASAVMKYLNRAGQNGSRFKSVMSIGLAGSFSDDIGLGDSLLAKRHWMLDEGAVLPDPPGFRSLEESGWAKTSFELPHGELYERLSQVVMHECNVGTVSTISGTNEQRDAYRQRAPVQVETMESAAIAGACQGMAIEYEDVRVISNFCGERMPGNHNFPGALARLQEIIAKLIESDLFF